MSIIYYEANVSESNSYGYKSDKLRASIVKTEYDKNGKLIKKSYVEDILVEKAELSEDEAKMLFFAFQRQAKVVSTIDEIV